MADAALISAFFTRPARPNMAPAASFVPSLRRYNALVYRSGATTTPLFNVSLAANGTTTSGTTRFEEELTLPAGPYQLEIATANVHGLGGKTAASAEFTVGECLWDACCCLAQAALLALQQSQLHFSPASSWGSLPPALTPSTPEHPPSSQASPLLPPSLMVLATRAAQRCRCCAPAVCQTMRWPPTLSRPTATRMETPRWAEVEAGWGGPDGHAAMP